MSYCLPAVPQMLEGRGHFPRVPNMVKVTFESSYDYIKSKAPCHCAVPYRKSMGLGQPVAFCNFGRRFAHIRDLSYSLRWENRQVSKTSPWEMRGVGRIIREASTDGESRTRYIGQVLPLFWRGGGEGIRGANGQYQRGVTGHTLRDTHREYWVVLLQKGKTFLALEHHGVNIIIHSFSQQTLVVLWLGHVLHIGRL